MILPEVIDLPFKAERDYLQGGDIFNALVSLACPFPPISLRLHQIMRELIIVKQWGTSDHPEGIFLCKDSAGEEQKLSLHSAARTSPIRRVPFDEQAVIRGHQSYNRRIEMMHRDDVSFIERCIALNKTLHKNMFPFAAGRWILVRIDLVRNPDSSSKIALSFCSNTGTRLTRVELEADGSVVGDLYFSLVNS
jgi:hypothetical protein